MQKALRLCQNRLSDSFLNKIQSGWSYSSFKSDQIIKYFPHLKIWLMRKGLTRWFPAHCWIRSSGFGQWAFNFRITSSETFKTPHSSVSVVNAGLPRIEKEFPFNRNFLCHFCDSCRVTVQFMVACLCCHILLDIQTAQFTAASNLVAGKLCRFFFAGLFQQQDYVKVTDPPDNRSTPPLQSFVRIKWLSKHKLLVNRVLT